MNLENPMSAYEFWKTEIEAAEKRQKEFWKDGVKVVDRFLDERNVKDGGKNEDSRLNLFYANISTSMAMLYGRVPKIDSSRRFDDAEDDVGRVAAEMMGRILNTDIESPGDNTTDVLRSCLQDRLLPGLGVARVRYEFSTGTAKGEEYDGDESSGFKSNETEYEILEDEESCTDYVFWKDFLWGHAHTWKMVPWAAYRNYLTKPEATERFGAELANQLNYNKVDQKEEAKNPDKQHPWDKAEVFEIWNRADRNVYWFSKDVERVLDRKEDPLKLKSFFPSPEPMAANTTTTLYLPRSDFKIAQDLYNEIDTYQKRIKYLTRALKVVGAYNKGSAEIKRIFQEGVENDLIPVDQWAAFAEKGGLEGQIDWVPIETIAKVLEGVQKARQQSIDLLYQVTGMADILRGQSGEYTSASSDQLKAKFASIRMQYLQEEFARFATDLMALKSEVIRRHFEAETIIKHSNAKFMPEEPMLIQQAAQMLVEPTNDILWRIQIRPETLAMVDYAQLKAERTEYLTATATFLQSSKAMVEVAPEAAPAIISMLKWGLAGYRGASEVEGALDKLLDSVVQKLQNPQPQQPNPKIAEIQLKAQSEQAKQAQKAQLELNNMMQEHYMRMQEIMAESDADSQREKMNAYFNILEHQQKMMLEKTKQQGQIKKQEKSE